jgi:hypothetical protein
VTDLLVRLEALEREVTYDRPPPDGRPPFAHQPGTLPVLLSAPHGAIHRRAGRLKAEDEYTAAVARWVAEATGAHALYTVARLDDDPNYDPASPYKAALAEIVGRHGIRFVLDIHGMSNRHKFGLALGTMRGASCPRRGPVVMAALEAGGFRPATADEVGAYEALRWDRYVLDHSRFTGGLSHHTVTRFAAETLGVEAAQIELCSSLRVVRRMGVGKEPADFRGDPEGIGRAVSALAAVVRAVAVSDGPPARLP